MVSISSRQPAILLIGGHAVEAYEGDFYTVHNYADHVHALAEHAGQVVFIAAVRPAAESPTGTRLDSALVEVQPLPLVKEKSPAAWRALQQMIADGAERAAGIVESFPAAGGMLSPYYRQTRTPKLVYLKTDYRERMDYRLANARGKRVPDYLRRYYYGLSQDYAVRRADSVVVRGGALAAQYQGQARQLEQSRPIASFGADFAYERPDSCQDRLIRLLFVGHLSKRKNVLGLVTAVAQAQQQLSDSHTLELTLVGAEHHTTERVSMADVQGRADELGIGAQVTCTGRIDDKETLAGYYRRADIFVLASWVEGFPRVINEALLHSLPVVTTAAGGVTEDLTDGQQVLIVPPGDMTAFAERIVDVVNSSALRQKLIRQGYEWAAAALAEPAWRQQVRLLGLT